MRGWEIASKFLGNAHNIAEGEDAIGNVVNGTYPMDEHWASGVLMEQNDRDYKFQIMTPEIGEPFVVVNPCNFCWNQGTTPA